jgi:tetratricopeptide (TPR) repeat protein
MRHGLFILFVCVASLCFAQDLQSQAQTAVFERRFGDALTLYRNLLAGSLTEGDYVLWIARLSAWTDDYTGSADYCSQALGLYPKDVDAFVGKTNVLMWRHIYSDVFALLMEATKLAPANPDVELAWSRYYHWQGEDAEAKLHLEKCLAFDVKNKDGLKLKESLVPDHTIELRIAYEPDTLPGTTPGAIEQLGATYFNWEGDIGVDYFHLNRFGEAGSRGGLHISRKLGGATSGRGAFRRDSYIGGITLALTRKTRAENTYTLARRSTGTFESTFLLALVHTL